MNVFTYFIIYYYSLYFIIDKIFFNNQIVSFLHNTFLLLSNVDTILFKMRVSIQLYL